MTGARADLALFLAGTRPLRALALTVCGCAMVAMLLVVTVQSLRQSPSQVADQIVGRFDVAVQSQSVVDADATAVDDTIVAALDAADGDDITVGYRSFDLHTTDGASLFYEENAWTRTPFPERYTLTTGHWPTAPGEVVVSPVLDPTPGGDLSVRPGGTDLHVVGIVTATYARDTRFILAAPGTWQLLQQGWTGRDFQPTATRDILWNGADPDAAIAALASVIGEDPGQVASERWSRDDLDVETPNLGPAEWALGLGGPLAGSIAGGIYLGLFTRRLGTQLHTLGIPRTTLRGAVIPAAAASALVGAATGVLLGLSVSGLLLRPILDHVRNTAPGDVYALPTMAALICATAVLGAAASIVAAGPHRRHARSHAPNRGRVILLVTAILTFLIGVTVTRQSVSFDGRTLGMLLSGGGVVLTIPLAWRAVFRARGTGGPVDLGIRRLNADQRPGSLTATIIAALILIGAATNTMVLTVLDSANANSESTVAPHHIEYTPTTGTTATDLAAVAALQTHMGLPDPVPVIVADGAVTLLDGATLLVPDTRALEQLIARPLTPAETAVLDAGGTLRTKTPNSGTVTFQTNDGDTLTVSSALIENIDPSYRTIDGFMLTDHTDPRINHGPTTYVFTNIADSVIATTDQAAEALGIDPATLQTYRAPDEYTAPLTVAITALSVALLTSLALAGYTTGLARRMRPHLATLRSLGTPRTWLTHVIGTQITGVILIALSFGILAGISSATIALATLGVTDTTPPWTYLATLTLALTVTAALTAILTTRRLRTTERDL